MGNGTIEPLITSLNDRANPTQEIVKALLYTGNARNPNFQNLGRDVAANIIAWSTGPSGHNIEYFFSVHEYLARVGAQCTDTFTLVERVREVREALRDMTARLTPT